MGNGGSFAASGVYAVAGGICRSVAPAPAPAAWSVLAPMSGQGVPGGHARWAVSRTVATPGGVGLVAVVNRLGAGICGPGFIEREIE